MRVEKNLEKLRCRNGRTNETHFEGDNFFVKTAEVQEESGRKRLAREAWALGLSKERGLSVPKVIEYGRDDKDCEFIKLERIHGLVLSRFPVNSQIEIIRKIGQEMTRLKSVSDGFGWPNTETSEGEYKEWNEFLYDFTVTYGERLANRCIISDRIFSNLLKEIKCFDFSVRKADLIHRDIKSNNILVSEDLKKHWLIDWENAFLGDGIFDVAVYGSNYGHNRLWGALVEGYCADGGSIVDSKKYKLYEAISLIGTIDFLRKMDIDFSQQIDSLKHLSKELHLDR